MRDAFDVVFLIKVNFNKLGRFINSRMTEINRKRQFVAVIRLKRSPLVSDVDGDILLDADKLSRCILFFDTGRSDQKDKR